MDKFCKSRFIARKALLLCRKNAQLRGFKFKSKPHEHMDDPVAADEQFHPIPMGDSDVPMQTRVSFLSKDMIDNKQLGIRAVSPIGFRMLDGSFMFGPIAMFPKTVLSWRVVSPEQITPESLELFFLLQPKLDIFILGAGDKKNVDKIRYQVAPVLSKNRIGYEIMETEEAAPLFNFLSSEERCVAGAFFPPQEVHVGIDQNTVNLDSIRGWDTVDENPFLYGLRGSDTYVSEVINSFYRYEFISMSWACRRIWGDTPEALKAEEQLFEMREQRRADKKKHLDERLAVEERKREELRQLERSRTEGGDFKKLEDSKRLKDDTDKK